MVRVIWRVHSHLPRKGDGMYPTVLCSRMNNTMSKLVKLCQMVLNSVAALYSWNLTALVWIERISMSFG